MHHMPQHTDHLAALQAQLSEMGNRWKHLIDVASQDTIAPHIAAVETAPAPISDPGDPARPDKSFLPYDMSDISTLLFMLEEEKMAGDLYEAFGDLYGTRFFDNIAASEDNHFDALLNQAEQLGLFGDSFVFADAGEFQNDELQDLYDALLAQGSQSLTDALEVGRLIELTDIDDITAAMSGVTDTVLEDVYQNLLDGSFSHLAAFEAQLT
ncbi:hypothetical protein SAMN06265173_15211 [Thalassovita litoralis]|jgi:hypothetical protein|uniref:DUF2202 domain-containing protein n=1 Tax=Thalassovita litoralis TaxID=1010611 RepID=A0A521FT83_9RHOB|nr:DUF2202 domain-containing protein [Thalassovita litoralis]SMO99294.1 hypothetical protein SAMN06265173_15211 [Thalassovita litoralis]